MTTLGNRLRSCRKERGVSQTEVGKAVGMSQANVSDLENDLYPTSVYIVKLAEYFGVTPQWLEKGTGQKQAEIRDSRLDELISIYQRLDDESKEDIIKHGKWQLFLKKKV